MQMHTATTERAIRASLCRGRLQAGIFLVVSVGKAAAIRRTPKGLGGVEWPRNLAVNYRCGTIDPVMLAALLVCATMFAQSATSVTPHQTFYVHGIITYYKDTAAPGAQVTFESDKVSKTVSTDKNGWYEADLPVGFYTMTVSAMKRGFREYRRPLFRAASSTNLTLDATVAPGMSCDLVVPRGSEHTITAEESQDECGGLDLFAVPSKDGVPFQLSIDYPGRQRIDGGNIYESRNLPELKIPILVTYNLFTLQANRVEYDVRSRTLRATGDVLVEGVDGTTQRGDSMTFKIENGEAISLP
jgi:hypothetical protein